MKLSAQHLELVKILAAKLFRLRWGDEIAFEEYYQSGVVGLLEAADRFNPAMGVKFSTFATPRITGAILNSLIHASEAQEQRHARKRMLAQRIASIADVSVGDQVSEQDPDAQPAERDNATNPDPLLRLAEAAVGLAIGFLLEDTGMYQTTDAAIDCKAYHSAGVAQTATRLRQSLAHMNPRDREILERHYYCHESFEEIGLDLKISKGRVSQIHSRALKALRGQLRGTSLDDFEA